MRRLLLVLLLIITFSDFSIQATEAKVNWNDKDGVTKKSYEWFSKLFNNLEINVQKHVIKLLPRFKEAHEGGDSLDLFLKVIHSNPDIEDFFNLLGSDLEEMKMHEVLDSKIIVEYLDNLEKALKKNFAKNILSKGLPESDHLEI